MTKNIDYKTIWIKWLTFLGMDLKFRKEILDALHVEITTGFDVITKVLIEELGTKIHNKSLYKSAVSDLEMGIASSVWSGYVLYLIQHGIDPVKENLVARTQTSQLGNMWMEAYQKDQGKELVSQADPILSLFLGKHGQSEMNKLLLTHVELADAPYKKLEYIETGFNWAAHQGYVFGLLEAKLHI